MHNKKRVFTAACLGMLLFGITLVTLGSIAPTLTSKFELTRIAAGTLFSILPFGILAGSLLFGPFCDKYGYKHLLIIASIFVGLGLEGIAFAPSLSLLQICIILFGIGGGCINGATNALVADISDTSKGGNLSLLGVFFGVGALGMPSLLGLMENVLRAEHIVAGIGLLSIAVAIIFVFIQFPLPKHANGFPIRRSLALLKEPTLVIIALFLFCQCSFEAIINNWTTTFLMSNFGIPQHKALYALSFFIIGMTGMRLLMGSIFRNLKAHIMLLICFGFLITGCGLLFSSTYIGILAGMVGIGCGLAGGFPIMFARVASKYTDLSATAFSLVLVIAMLGNMSVNYLVGIMAQAYGIHNLYYIILAEIGLMTILGLLIFRNPKQTQ